MTRQTPIKVLLVEDHAGDARLTCEVLIEAGADSFDVDHVVGLAQAHARLARGGIEVVLLDLTLPDASGLVSVTHIRANYPGVPIIVLSGLDDEGLALEALQEGAQDYIVKGIESSNLIARAIRYAIERGKAEQMLIAATERAELANRAKSEFLANMSHELRTPLNAIIGFAEVMKAEHLGPLENRLYREYIDDIHGSGVHLLEIINDILDLAKVESGRVELSEEQIDVAKLVEAAMRMVRERAQGNGIRLETQIDAAVPSLFADRRLVLQVLVNLLSNAVKFTPGEGRVTVSARLTGDGGLALSVADTGIGIAEADLAKAMAPFGQVDGGLSRKYEGTGLGLPLTKRLVELHGGSLDIESEPAVGTVATVRLPARRLTHAGDTLAAARLKA